MAGDSWRERVIAILPMLILGLGFLDLFLNVLPGVPFFLVFIVGFAVVLPIVALLLGGEGGDHDDALDETGRTLGETFDRAGEDLDRVFGGGTRDRRGRRDAERSTDVARASDEGNTRDAIETLRNRYARGELTDEQFEAKLDRLMETDTPENAAEWRERERDREREGERSR